jgi:hypothetical protein
MVFRFALAASLLALACPACSTDDPPRPRHVSAATYSRATAPGASHLGDSEGHAFIDIDCRVLYTDTADLTPAEQASVKGAAKGYIGRGSKVKRH